ncbi:acyl-CoA dehydrogenase/long-chain-acyl-CoA dehydrogenase [Halopolyspora algeriensis]|uniref:Acyl-[acyl-carrier-protein] dehydrogenase MbtN n=1 Tax=Halopolyspora algeriensis TaxID=1500506 RepID=A0A368W045_9ACTN|nr:acyl-CoA dehydrogenase family protein [Halopolyspora algeriensis]RCW45961.1 acyl-CoA dehydrogenase/long-chain-acyl-CoA dehydrogenase [Halopolyspora algeriensis]TQM55374.1 acyl-CoA dehydrogenase/long-chain-acyl-CoA dehydrogenase [Halopolyspora algeriensis]
MSSVSLQRTIFDDEHDIFRQSTRAFAEQEVAPYLEKWAEQGHVDRDIYRRAGELGLLGISAEEKYNGGGVDDFRFHAVLIEELGRVGATAVAMNLSGFNDLVAPYLTSLADDEQKQRRLAPLCSGELIGALAMTEPEAGSDLAAITTTAIPDGDDLVLNGAKTFISNGMIADVFLVVARTDPSAGRQGMSIVLVDADTPGFTRSGPLRKVGLSAQDTAELAFDNARVPRANILGEENRGFEYLRGNLPQERLSVAVTAMAALRRTFEQGLSHSCQRTAFGRRIADFQANRFYLAELATEIEIAQTFVDRCILDASAGKLDEVTAAMAKWWVTELQQKVVGRCLQLHGGYGFMAEYDVAQDYLDCRGGTLYAGTTEIMKEIIGRKLTKQ